MKKFLKWWSVAGQFLGFILHIAINTSLIVGFSQEAKHNSWIGLLFLVVFFGGASWYAWQMRVHGWKLPNDIKNTH